MNGLDLLGIVLVVVVVFFAVELWEWKQRDEDRRLERLRRRGLA